MSPIRSTVSDEPLTLEVLREIAMTTATRTPESTQSEPLDGSAVWRGLLDGCLCLVERFEQGGRRYYVMRHNHDDALPFASLAPRERQVAEILGGGESEKAAAYALGLSPSAVSGLLRRALMKLRVRSRVDLVLLVKSMRADTAA